MAHDVPWNERAAILFRAAAIMRAPAGRAGRARGLRGREAGGRGRRRRLRGDRLLRVLRAGGAPALGPARRVGQVAGRDQHVLATSRGHRRGDLAVELPARDPHRHGHGRVGHRQWRAVQAGGADARRRAPSGRDPRTRRASRPACSPSSPASARRSAPPSSSTRRSRSSRSRDRRRSACTIIERAAVLQPGQRQVKRVLAEMGGKNAIVVDADADLDLAVPAIVASAFGYAGPEVLGRGARDRAGSGVRRARRAGGRGGARSFRSGPAQELRTVFGPLIDTDAYERVRRYQSLARDEADVIVEREDLPDGGWYRGPNVAVTDNPRARIVTDEIFGPVLVMLRATDFDHALALANDTDYALTAGLFSRSPSRIARATRSLRAGDVYVNRGITGARVGRQPFGGSGLSGVGSQGGRARLPVAVRRIPRGHREHDPAGFRTTTGRTGVSAITQDVAFGARSSRRHRDRSTPRGLRRSSGRPTVARRHHHGRRRSHLAARPRRRDGSGR